MIEQLSQMQARIQKMRDALLKEGSVLPDEESIITSLDAKKKVLWYLDLLAAAVAGAHRHLSNMEHDDIFSATEKEGMQKQIIERLRHDLGATLAIVKSLDLQDLRYLEMDFMEAEARKANEWQPPLNGPTHEDALKERQIHSETFGQLWMVRNQVADMLQMLGALT
jgi:hypothetical protein